MQLCARETKQSSTVDYTIHNLEQYSLERLCWVSTSADARHGNAAIGSHTGLRRTPYSENQPDCCSRSSERFAMPESTLLMVDRLGNERVHIYKANGGVLTVPSVCILSQVAKLVMLDVGLSRDAEEGNRLHSQFDIGMEIESNQALFCIRTEPIGGN